MLAMAATTSRPDISLCEAVGRTEIEGDPAQLSQPMCFKEVIVEGRASAESDKALSLPMLCNTTHVLSPHGAEILRIPAASHVRSSLDSQFEGIAILN